MIQCGHQLYPNLCADILFLQNITLFSFPLEDNNKAGTASNEEGREEPAEHEVCVFQTTDHLIFKLIIFVFVFWQSACH